jgi:outer membrane protein, heavy metal efflux system
VSIPLRIFDEPGREEAHADRHRPKPAGQRSGAAQVFSDVDTAYELVRSNIALLKPYKAKYNDQALRVRDTVTFAYQHGGASLMDFLNAQSDYRQVQLAYLQLTRRLSDGAGPTESRRWTRDDSIEMFATDSMCIALLCC